MHRCRTPESAGRTTRDWELSARRSSCRGSASATPAAARRAHREGAPGAQPQPSRSRPGRYAGAGEAATRRNDADKTRAASRRAVHELPHLRQRTCPEFVGSTEEREPAALEQPDVGAEQQRFAGVVRHKDQGFAEPGHKGAKLPLQLEARHWIERAKGLIEEEERWIVGEGARHTDALSLTTGELMRVSRAERHRIESDEREQLTNALLGAGGRPARQAGQQGGVRRRRGLRERAEPTAQRTDGPRGT